MRKMKKNNFYKHITIGEDDDYYGGIKEVCDNIGIDYTDYDYLSDLVWGSLLSIYSLYPPINTPSLNIIGKYI